MNKSFGAFLTLFFILSSLPYSATEKLLATIGHLRLQGKIDTSQHALVVTALSPIITHLNTLDRIYLPLYPNALRMENSTFAPPREAKRPLFIAARLHREITDIDILEFRIPTRIPI